LAAKPPPSEAGQRVDIGAIVRDQRRRGIDIGRRAELGGHGGEIDVLGEEGAVAIGESGHVLG